MPKVVAFTRMRERKRLRPLEQPRPRVRWRVPGKRWLAVGLLGFALVALPGAELGLRAAGCDIKGNISRHTGERIYHVPGQTYYAETVVNFLAGERFFCTEAGARAAGWRRAKL